MDAVRSEGARNKLLVHQLGRWVASFPGMTDPNEPIQQKYQPLYASIATTALNGRQVFLMGINPGMDADFARGLEDWKRHLPAYREGMFGASSRYHSYLDYHPRGKVVRGFENMLGPTIAARVSLSLLEGAEWLRSIPVGNLFVRATHNVAGLGSFEEEPSSLPLLDLLKPGLIVLMGSDDKRMQWMANQGLIREVRRHLLPFRDARDRSIIVRSAKSFWGGLLVAAPHPNAISGNQLQRQVGTWLEAQWPILEA